MAGFMKPQPYATIAARQLVEHPDSYSGWLRRRGKLERMLEGVFKFINIKWRQRFVILADGSLYMFKDETANVPLKACSLADYSVVKRAIEEPEAVSRVPWCFLLEPLTTDTVHYFSCTCQKEMDTWMTKLKKEMLKAHNLPVPSESKFSSLDYTFLETPVVRDQSSSKEKMKKTVPSKPHKSSPPPVFDDDDTDDEDDYFEIHPGDMDTRAKDMPLPPIPNANQQPKKRPETNFKPKTEPKHLYRNEKPPPTAKPRPFKPDKSRTLSSDDFMFNSNDKDAAAELLEKIKSTGVFLVRKSRKSKNQEVLAVNTPNGVREYQIFDVENKKSLDKNQMFATVEKLVEFYQTHKLPTQPITLSKSYSLVDLSAQ